MKLTWFGGTTLRIYIGGQILVSDAPADAGEIISGADRLFRLSDTMPAADKWRPRQMARLIDEVTEPVLLHRLGKAVLIDAVGEPPLLLGTPDALGRWASDAVVVLFEPAPPPPVKLIALALADVDAAIAAMRPQLDGAALVALEPGLALEI